MLEPRDAPGADDALGRRQRGPRIHDRRAAIRRRERQGHRAVARQERAAVLVQRVRHLELATGELLICEPRTLLEYENAYAVAHQASELLGYGAAARPRADHGDAARPRAAHRPASH